ncbi:MAG: penicillin-binding transpeptidase domain-containing protein [Thermodesulfobacteriota bacterium]
MRRRTMSGLLVLALATSLAGGAGAAERADLGRHFRGNAGTFVLLDAQTGRTLRHDAERARRRFVPASTFKVPNSLIALDTGVAAGPDFAITRDDALAPPAPWWPPAWSERTQTMRTALSGSVVWYYQELARRIGPARIQAYLDRFDYGNRDLSGGIDRFWLTGGLRISAEEQVAFLRRLYFGELGVSERTTRIVKQLLVLEDTGAYRLSGKTGWAGFGEPSTPQVGWLVGWVERGTDVHLFALNLDVRSEQDAAARLAITKAILRDAGVIDR